MAGHRREPPEERDEEDRRRKTTTSTSYSREARRTAAAQVVTSYNYLRESCPLLPQTGRLSKYHILQGAADQMRALKYENDFLRWRVAACWAVRERNTGLQGQESAGEPETQVVRDQTDVHEDQPSLPQDQVRQDAGERGGDDLQIVEVRGGCQWPVTPTHQAQSRSQSPEREDDLARQREVVARVRGGEASGNKQKVTEASTGGGRVSGDEQEDECMEIRVVWGGTIENPVPIVPHPRPRMPDSPPFPERSWMARPVGRKIQVGSSTLQRIIRTTPISQTSSMPTTLNIPTRSLGEPGEDDMSPMDLSNRNPAVQEMLRKNLRTAEPPPLISIERWSACPPPSCSQVSGEEPPTHGIAQILKAAVIIERARLAAQDTMMEGVEDEEVVNVPVLGENEKDIGVETIPTRNELWSPASDVMWVDAPALVIDLEATPVTEPEPTTPLTTAPASVRGTSPSRAVLRVAKWVGDLGGNSANHQEMEGDMNNDVQGEKVDSVRENTSFAEGVQEVENEDVQAQHGEMGSNEMWVDEEEVVTTSEAATREEVEEELDVGGPETVADEEVPGLVHGSSMGEYVEPVDQKEMMRALFEDPQNEIEDLTTSETKPVVIPRWPRHLASHHGEIEDSEVLGDDPNPPADLSPPVGSILESVWIDVVPNGDAIEIRHQVVSEDTEPEIGTPTSEDRLKDEIISDEEIAMSLERDSEGEGGERVKDTGEEDEEGRVSEGEGGEETKETGEEDETIQVKDAYVALRKLKIRRWKIREKTSKKKKRQRWMFEKDRDWKPPRRKKVKITPKIKLIRTRPISEDEEPTEPRNRQSRLKRIWKGTNFKHQDEIITFYQTVPKKKMREGKKSQRKRRREEEQGVYGGFVTITLPDRAGRSSISGRQYRRRNSDSGVWEAELRGGQLNGPDQRERLEVNLETNQGEEQEDRHMEEGGLAQDTVGADPEVVMGQDLEEKSGPKRSPSTKEEIGLGRDEGAQEEKVSEKETTGTDSAQEGSGEGEDPRRDSRATEEGEIAEEAEADERPRPTTPVAAFGVSNSSAPISGVQDLLRKWVEEGVHGLACEVRVRSAEPPPRPLDQEMSRGKSMR